MSRCSQRGRRPRPTRASSSGLSPRSTHCSASTSPAMSGRTSPSGAPTSRPSGRCPSSPTCSPSGSSPAGRPDRTTDYVPRSCQGGRSPRTRRTRCWSPGPAICLSAWTVTTTSSCCRWNGGRSTTTAFGSTTAPTTARNWAPTAASRQASRPKAASGRSTTTPTTCLTSGSGTPGRVAGSPFRGPGWARSRRRSRTLPGGTPARCWPSAARTTPTNGPSPQRSRTC